MQLMCLKYRRKQYIESVIFIQVYAREREVAMSCQTNAHNVEKHKRISSSSKAVGLCPAAALVSRGIGPQG